MLARLQQFTTLLLVTASLAWATYFVRQGRPGWALGAALLIAFGYALVLALQFVAVWFTHRNDPVPRANVGQLLRAWFAETRTGPLVFCWRQPFRANVEPDFMPAGCTQRGVVLVHGFVCNRGLWTPWLTRLRRLGVPFVAVNLEPVFGSIDDYVPIIDAAVTRLTAATGQAPVIVCHSMGGVAARAWLDCCGGDERVHRIVTIGTPHHGTWLGRFAQTINGRQMNIGNEWLLQMVAREPLHRAQRFTCFYGNCDNIVFPTSTATLAGADNRHLPGWAHVHMVSHPAVFDEVLRLLGVAKPGATAAIAPGAAAGSAR